MKNLFRPEVFSFIPYFSFLIHHSSFLILHLIKKRVFAINVSSQMLISQLGDFTASRRTLQETFLDEERFVHFFHRTGIFTESRGDGGQAHWTSIELIDNGGENLVVDFIQAIAVDVQGFEGITGNLHIDASVAFHLGKVTHSTEQGIGNTRSASASGSNLAGCLYIARHIEDACRTLDNASQDAIVVILQVEVDAETGTKRSGKQTASGSCTHQRERTQFQLDASGRRALVYHDIDAIVFHSRIQVFFHDRTQAMDFINEKHIVRFEARKDTCQVARFVEYRAGCHLESYAQFIRYDVTQRGLSQARRAMQKHVVQRLGTKSGSLDEDAQIVHHLVLSVEVTEVQRSQGILEIALLLAELLFSDVKFFSHFVFIL